MVERVSVDIMIIKSKNEGGVVDDNNV